MKSKAPLTLVEYLVMILVFSLSIAICLKVFAFSDNMSRQSVKKGMAYSVAKNTAETLKSCSGDMEKAAEILGYSYDTDTISYEYDGIKMITSKENTDINNLGGAVINVTSGNDVLCTIHVRYQEGIVQ